MNRPGLVTRRPDPTSLSSRKRQATLRVILLPLDIAESADPVPVPAVDYVEPFLPARISAPTTTGDDGPHAQLLAFRHIVDRSSPPITFGIALDNQRAPDSPQRPYVGPPATCLSLWEVPGNGLVLACEELAPDRTGGLIDRHHDPLRGDGSPELWTAIEAFLRPFGLTPEASPIDVFPRLDTRLPRSEVYRRLRSLTMHSPPRTDRDTVEGLVIEVHTDGVDTVRRLVDEPSTTPCTEAASPSYRGLLRWHRAPLTDRPWRPGSGIAIREDARVLAVDLGATATSPDYLDRGTRNMLYGLIGWVALRAQHSADHRRVLSLLRNRRHLCERGGLAGLGDIAAARTRMIETRLLQTHLTSAHRCPPWIASTHLRSTLVHRTADEIALLHTDLGKLCDSAESSLLHHAAASARDRRSTLVAVAAAGALFATSLHAAGAASLEDLQRWGLTVAVVTAIGAVALLEGVARRRPSGTLTIPRPVSPPLASPAVKPVKDLERRRRESIFPFETDLWRTAPPRREMTPTLRECLEANNLSDFGPSISPPVMASRSSRPESE
ncbi:hypothetical protein [Rhodococcus sp. IEGM 1307]|uniref:hypothetical protein n=1 Tax=Rhodococcus sp. IEGM 1307 TaxID=3047091 RepID=UPI0024B854A1|nr:hypothetical protein [Rhodococcus sp. IEGM 1307]MDI9973665.1 hypothetical protein [Rhodococcus sp. IEGM 1307]